MEVLGEGTEAGGGGAAEGQQVERKGERTEGKPGRREESAPGLTATLASQQPLPGVTVAP